MPENPRSGGVLTRRVEFLAAGGPVGRGFPAGTRARKWHLRCTKREHATDCEVVAAVATLLIASAARADDVAVRRAGGSRRRPRPHLRPTPTPCASCASTGRAMARKPSARPPVTCWCPAAAATASSARACRQRGMFSLQDAERAAQSGRAGRVVRPARGIGIATAGTGGAAPALSGGYALWLGMDRRAGRGAQRHLHDPILWGSLLGALVLGVGGGLLMATSGTWVQTSNGVSFSSASGPFPRAPPARHPDPDRPDFLNAEEANCTRYLRCSLTGLAEAKPWDCGGLSGPECR